MSDVQTGETVASEGGNSTLVILLGVLGGVVVLALLWLFVIDPLFLAEDIDEPVVQPPPPPAEEVEPEPTPEPTPVPETFEVFTARDPFQQLAQPAVAAPPAAPTAPPADPTAPPADPTAPPADPDAPPPDAEVGATRVRLVDVFVDDDGVQKVLVTVNGTGHEVAEGEEFAGRFRVLDISPPCATFLFGDSRFVLCMGEEIRK
jgi:hypothetical protein